MTWTAYLDESEPEPRFGSVGTYLVAAALIEDVDQEQSRAVVDGLRLPGQKKLHWTHENHKRRAVVAEAVGRLHALHLLVVRVDEAAGPERRRRQCLTRLLPEIYAAGVVDVRMESRERKQNARDVELLNGLRSRRLVGPELRIEHQPGPSDPLLWVPDVVAGAVGAQRRGDPSYVEHFAGTLTYYEA